LNSKLLCERIVDVLLPGWAGGAAATVFVLEEEGACDLWLAIDFEELLI
jgi:hypothetical protein